MLDSIDGYLEKKVSKIGVFAGFKLHHLKLANREFSYYVEDDRG